jgi:hypothetical protein
MVFQCNEPVQAWVSAPVNQKLRTMRYRTVIRDQRCLCAQLDPLRKSCSHMRLCSGLTQTNSIYRTTLSEMTSSNHVNPPLVQMPVLENTAVGIPSIILLTISPAHPNHILPWSRMRLRNYRQNLSETACSPRTCEIAVQTKIADYWPQHGIIWDYGHIEGIAVNG